MSGTYACATPGCGRLLRDEHWLYSQHTGNRYCYPAEGCHKWTSKQRRKARATALYEELRQSDDRRLAAIAAGARVDVQGFGKQQVIATLIDAASADGGTVLRLVLSSADGAPHPAATRRKEPTVATKQTEKPVDDVADATPAEAAPAAQNDLYETLLGKVKDIDEAKVDVHRSPTDKYDILKVDGKTIGYVNPSKSGVRVEARGTIEDLPARLRERFEQRKPHLVATAVTEKGQIAGAVDALKAAAKRIKPAEEAAVQ